ncbi:MAG TPA: hypothetical protein VEF06_09725 [Bryobacteraceae bacterium]|nr:hypothetical protein [Bryobacteraceae bacterium]
MKSCIRAFAAVFALILPAASLAAGEDTAIAQAPDFAATAFAPGALAEVSLGTLFDQATVAVPEWGSGREGLGRRAGLLVSSHLIDATVTYSLGQLRSTTTAYSRCRCKGFPRRARHAIVAQFIEHGMDGSVAAPVARFSGLATSVLASAPLLPARYGAGYALERAETRIGVDIGLNLLDEFWPEIRRTLSAPLKRLH